MPLYESVEDRSGNRLQAGIPKRMRPENPLSARGLLARGVVVATYVVDDPKHPFVDRQNQTPIAVYCDVLLYSGFTGGYRFVPKVLVSQPRGGVHSGHPWKPKAITQDVTGNAWDLDKATNPANLDGDHVLVGFMDGVVTQPVILRALPHPSADIGNAELSLGHRVKLQLADGDPDFVKHHGSYYGILDNGDHVTDTTFANDGILEEKGLEKAPPTDGSGAVRALIPQDAEHAVELFDMADPAAPVSVARETFQKALKRIVMADAAAVYELKIEGGDTLIVQKKDAAAELQLGDGAKHAAIVEALEALWGNLKTTLDTWGGAGGHTHPTGVGPSGPPTPVLVTDAWNSAGTINSTKVSFPDG